MSNNSQINASTFSINTDPLSGCLGAAINHVSPQLRPITKRKPFSANTFMSNSRHMSSPSQLCGAPQVRHHIQVFAYSGFQTEEYQAGEEHTLLHRK